MRLRNADKIEIRDYLVARMGTGRAEIPQWHANI